MKNLLIRNGRLLSPKDGYYYDKLDILVGDGKIKEIGKGLQNEKGDILELNGEIVSPGFMDIHTHCYKGKSAIGTEADVIGVQRGTTAIFDAGTSGPLNYDDFKENIIKRSKTHIYTFLNISNRGLDNPGELSDLKEINEDNVLSKVQENKNNILGIKVRASASVVGKSGIIPIEIGKRIAKKAGLPLVVHIGNYPPSIEEVISLLEKDDIVTHSYHGKKNGLFNDDGTPKKITLEARARGVKFDVGHGSESFSFNTFKKALKNGFSPDFISTDLYHKNMFQPVGSLLNVITKMIACGMTLEECVDKVSNKVAEFFKLDDVGAIKRGANADFTIFDFEECNELLKDSYGMEQEIKKKLTLRYVIISGGKDSEVLRAGEK